MKPRETLLEKARLHRSNLDDAKAAERYHTMVYIANALSKGHSWERMGRELHVTSTAVRRYYNRNKRR